MDPRFAESFLNRRHRVLGRKLRPFCLWHAFLLEQYGSPYAPGGDLSSATFADLIIATVVCAQGFGQPRFPRVTGFSRARNFFASLNFSRHHLAFASYLADYIAEPIVGQSGSGTAVKTPWQLFRVAQLMHYAKWTEVKAWTHPLGEAIWYTHALAEASGSKSNIASEADLEAFRQAGVTL